MLKMSVPQPGEVATLPVGHTAPAAGNIAWSATIKLLPLTGPTVSTGLGPAGLPSIPLGAPFAGRLSRKGFKFGVSKYMPKLARITRSPFSLGRYATPSRGEKFL